MALDSFKNSTPFVSIVVPAFNESERLPLTLEQLAAFKKSCGFSIEVIIVDNASTDDTKDVVAKYRARYPFIKYLYQAVRGKGAAVKTGILEGHGDYLLICDADMAVPIEEVMRFLPPQLRDYDIAIGSREVEGAKRFDEPFHRHFMGRVFNLIVRTLLLPGLHDTQCGFKCFHRNVGSELFSLSSINGNREEACFRREPELIKNREVTF